MNKVLYIFLIVFLGLSVASGICSSILNFRIGTEIYALDSYITWFLVVNITGVIGTILLLKYYYHNNYRFVFVTGIIAGIANLGYIIVFYIILSSGRLGSFYMPAIVVYICAIVVYSASLIFSNTRKRYLLKLAGICGLAIGLVLLAAVIAHIYPQEIRINNILDKLVKWSAIALGLVNLLFIMNFRDEIKILTPENADTSNQKPLDVIFGLAAVVAFVFTIAVGAILVSQSYTQAYWQNYNAEKSQGLVKLAGGDKTFVNSKGNCLHYVLIKPLDYDPQKKYPLVISLPYGGYEASAAEALSTDINRKAYPAFIFVPYCPEGKGWGGIPGVPSLDSLVYETISALAEPGIDVKRRYVTGLSRGAYGTWQFICTRPDMFAAAMPVSGRGDPKLASKVVNIPIWDFHGAKDRNVPVRGSRDMIAAIKKAGGHPEYTEYPDDGHNIWEKVSDTPGLWNWLFAQKQK